jgi:hypothetical protein
MTETERLLIETAIEWRKSLTHNGRAEQLEYEFWETVDKLIEERKPKK